MKNYIRNNALFFGSVPYKIFNRLRQTKTCQKMLIPLGKPLSPKRWIFIIGCYNSGTTLLDHILAQHPAIAGLPEEGVWLTDSLPRPEDFGWTRMWCKCLDKVRLEPTAGMDKRVERIMRQWSIWYPANLENCLEKSVVNATRMPFLETYFKPAYFIYIVRNGYAAAEGIRRKSNLARWKNSLYNAYPIELCAEQWKVSDELVSNDAEKLKHFKKIYYEDLVSDPKQVMKDVTDFLALDELPECIFEKSWHIHKIKSSIRNMNSRSFDRLSEKDFEDIELVAGGRLAAHGYYRTTKWRKCP